METALKQELANSISHGLGILFGIVAIPILVVVAMDQNGWSATIGVSIYGFSFLTVFVTSTLYHSLIEPSIKRVAQILDHISIYFLIAGSYTPFIIFFALDQRGLLLLATLWSLAFLGIFFKIFYIGRFRYLSLIIYIAMGWSLVVLPRSFFTSLPTYTWSLIVAGGILYTVGVFFYVREKWVWHHLIWHIFVLGASICHFFAVLFAMLDW